MGLVIKLSTTYQQLLCSRYACQLDLAVSKKVLKNAFAIIYLLRQSGYNICFCGFVPIFLAYIFLRGYALWPKA